jgi:ATP-dependent Clp protease protease subunit
MAGKLKPHQILEVSKLRKFWNWVASADGGRTLYLDGAISNETWWGDEITPAIFKEELVGSKGDITVWINSPGGDVFAGAQIYNMLQEYDGKITVKIDGSAASIASVIAMAGDEVLMSPVSTMVIHNPETIAFGDEAEMKRVKDMLAEIKQAIINAYEIKTKLPRNRISALMDNESWMNVKTAMELGFADGMLYSDGATNSGTPPVFNAVLFSPRDLADSLMKKLSPRAADGLPPVKPADEKPAADKNQNTPPPAKPDGVSIKALYERLFLLNKKSTEVGI